MWRELRLSRPRRLRLILIRRRTRGLNLIHPTALLEAAEAGIRRERRACEGPWLQVQSSGPREEPAGAKLRKLLRQVLAEAAGEAEMQASKARASMRKRGERRMKLMQAPNKMKAGMRERRKGRRPRLVMKERMASRVRACRTAVRGTLGCPRARRRMEGECSAPAGPIRANQRRPLPVHAMDWMVQLARAGWKRQERIIAEREMRWLREPER